MILRNELKILATNRYLDCMLLLLLGRYQGSIYIGGYTIELLLKYNICIQFGLNAGYPENSSDFTLYSRNIVGFNTIFRNIRDLKTHNLENLLIVSGREIDVKTKAITEWDNITSRISWNPEMRYLNVKRSIIEAYSFHKSLKKIKQILLKQK